MFAVFFFCVISFRPPLFGSKYVRVFFGMNVPDLGLLLTALHACTVLFVFGFVDFLLGFGLT